MDLQALKRRAKELGCIVEVKKDRENLEHEVLVTAPNKQVFLCSEVHQLVCAGSDGTTLEELYADAFERLSYGVGPCETNDCDVCHPFVQEYDFDTREEYDGDR